MKKQKIITKAKWVDRTLVSLHYKIALCTSEKDFNFELKRLKVPVNDWPVWLPDDAYANTHTLQGANKEEKIIIICIKRGLKNSTPCLIHEATHIFQHEMRLIQEDNPSDEFAAYSIEAIATNLIEAYLKKGKQ